MEYRMEQEKWDRRFGLSNLGHEVETHTCLTLSQHTFYNCTLPIIIYIVLIIIIIIIIIIGVFDLYFSHRGYFGIFSSMGYFGHF